MLNEEWAPKPAESIPRSAFLPSTPTYHPPTPGMKLIVGLGNPGKDYVGTRHNVGFEAIDTLAVRLGWVVAGEFDRLARNKFDALVHEGSFQAPGGAEKVLLMKPMTFMNLSGRSVQAAASFFRVEPTDLLVVVDELSLPAGRIRLRSGGSDGGHNGLQSVRQALGTDKYPRLRIGIDPPPPEIAGRDHVLGKFSAEQRPAIDAALPRAAGCCLTWAESGVEAAMNRFNPDPA